MLVFRKLDYILSYIAKAITALSICVQMVVMFFGVIFRYFIKSPLMWSDELASYLLVFVAFFGSYVALKEGALAKIELVTDKLPLSVRRIVKLVANLIVALLLAGILYFGCALSATPAVLKEVSPAMRIPTVVFYLVLPIAACMMIIHMITVIFDEFFDAGRESAPKGVDS